MSWWLLQTVVTLVAAVYIYWKIKNTRHRKSAVLDERDALKSQLRSGEEAKRRVMAVIESMAEGVMVVDVDQKILLMNSVLASAFDTRKQEAEGRLFWEVFRDPAINEMIEKALRDRYSFQSEHTPLLSDSTFQVQASPVFLDDEFLGVAAVFHDVTQLKELERLRTDFVANVSHELKTPLTSIMGSVETLKEGAMEDEAHRKKFLEMIEEHSKKLHHLIEDLLLLSKVESGQQILEKEPVDLEKILARVLAAFERDLKKKGISTRAEMSERPFLIPADSKSMEQVLSNLIDNAIKYNKPKGEILIRGWCEPDTVCVEISDTGIGIPESDALRIFERFYRVDKSRSRESGGTGLGLAIAKHIAERHGGRIGVRSVLQKGSQFTISLPRNIKA